MSLPARAIPVQDFALPDALEAHEPPEARGLARDGVRMLVTYTDGERIVHACFSDLPDFLASGDLLVLNVSATLPAALTASKEHGSEVAMHLSTRLPAGLHVVEFRQAKVKPGEQVRLPGGGRATVLAPHPGTARLWIVRLDLPLPLDRYLDRWGRPIRYDYLHGEWPLEAYQNVYATVPGSAEMPSAGRPFTSAVLAQVARRGVRIAKIVLHTGVSSPERGEPPYEEWFEVSYETAEAVEAARKANHHVIAVGTTTVRALESSVDAAGRAIASRGWTDLVVGPGRGVKLVDGLLTGFHEPRASHLDLVAAIAGQGTLERAYGAALEGGYLWHEFGDVHLILPAGAGPGGSGRIHLERQPRRGAYDA